MTFGVNEEGTQEVANILQRVKHNVFDRRRRTDIDRSKSRPIEIRLAESVVLWGTMCHFCRQTTNKEVLLRERRA